MRSLGGLSGLKLSPIFRSEERHGYVRRYCRDPGVLTEAYLPEHGVRKGPA
jgi:hypothetical protein